MTGSPERADVHGSRHRTLAKSDAREVIHAHESWRVVTTQIIVPQPMDGQKALLARPEGRPPHQRGHMMLDTTSVTDLGI